MASRNERGEYVNDKGVTIKINTDKSGKDHVSFYDKNPASKNHSAVHVNVDSNSKSYTSSSHNSDKSSKDSSSGSCYLTSACMQHFQDKFDDDCYELRVLRWFRDNFVSQEDIAHYYEVAPVIVSAIDNALGSDIAYDYIFDNVVDACVTAIENGDYNFAYARYKDSILRLEESFARPVPEDRLVKSLNVQTI